ncbi:MAG: ABC transporter ATP-binding protein, partial [Acidobacteriota bacterium]
HDLAVMEYLSDRIAVVYLGRIMELGPASAVCTSPRHPYTRALLSSAVTTRRRERRRRIILEGELPSPINPPSGCPFRTRCPHALPECAQTRPALRPVGPGRSMACLRDDLPESAPV